jgi:MoaA/NifB/PqqE/SkfB family radical SAM enzyme
MNKYWRVAKILWRIAQVRYFNSDDAHLFGSVEITNACTLKCKHCYWWKNWERKNELTIEQWRHIFKYRFKDRGVTSVTITGGEPLMRPDIIKMIILEEKVDTWITTNGTLPFLDLPTTYIVSIDGNEKTHNKIRPPLNKSLGNVYKRIEKNIEKSPTKNIMINMTLNNINKNEISDVVEKWYGVVKGVSFSFHTPFSYEDDLWIHYGKERNGIADGIKSLKKKYPNFIALSDLTLEMLKSSEWTADCAIREKNFVVSLDSQGRIKRPCVLGSVEKEGKLPICKKCGMDCAVGLTRGLRGDWEWPVICKNIFFGNGALAKK